jgi:hypothetical protein
MRNFSLNLILRLRNFPSLSAVTPLSALSIKGGNTPVKFPDFTRGRWKEERQLGMLGPL